VVRIGPHRLQVLPSNGKSNFARARIEVRHAFDNTIMLFCQGRKLEAKHASGEPAALRPSLHSPPIGTKPRVYAKPAPDHPWRGKFRKHIDRG
jgi:hypothetical protein